LRWPVRFDRDFPWPDDRAPVERRALEPVTSWWVARPGGRVLAMTSALARSNGLLSHHPIFGARSPNGWQPPPESPIPLAPLRARPLVAARRVLGSELRGGEAGRGRAPLGPPIVVPRRRSCPSDTFGRRGAGPRHRNVAEAFAEGARPHGPKALVANMTSLHRLRGSALAASNIVRMVLPRVRFSPRSCTAPRGRRRSGSLGPCGCSGSPLLSQPSLVM
jgi:hypothetical protein